MNYHIDTGLIIEKFNEDCECPLCEIQKVVEEQFLHEFLNDAVMEDSTRIKVGKSGFCQKHFEMLSSRPNKLSVALQMQTRAEKLTPLLSPLTKVSLAKKQARNIQKSLSSCVLCDYVNESMVKYYKTIAQMFYKEKDFYKTIFATKGFCLSHYAELLRYSDYAYSNAKEYLKTISTVQSKNFERIQTELDTFIKKHDYRNANKPLGSAETALPRTGIKFYGTKIK